jgi:glutaredoxin 3
MSAAKTKAQNLINDNGVVVFSKSYCPYCKASKDLLTKLGAKYEVLELDQIGTWNACAVFFCWRKSFCALRGERGCPRI